MYISDIGHQHPVRKSVNRFVKAADTNLKKKYAWHWEELSPGAIAKNQFINRRQAACAQHSCSPNRVSASTAWVHPGRLVMTKQLSYTTKVSAVKDSTVNFTWFHILQQCPPPQHSLL